MSPIAGEEQLHNVGHWDGHLDFAALDRIRCLSSFTGTNSRVPELKFL